MAARRSARQPRRVAAHGGPATGGRPDQARGGPRRQGDGGDAGGDPGRGARAVGGRRRPPAPRLHLLPPQPGARDPGGPLVAHAVRADHARGGPGPAGERGVDGQAADPRPPEDPPGPHPLPGAGRGRAAPAVGGGARDDLPGLQRGVRRDVRPPARARRPRRRGRPAGPAAGAAPTRRPWCARAAGADAAAGLTPGHAGRRRRRHRAARRPGPHPLGRRADRGGRHPGRRRAAALAGPARPLRRAGGDRGLPRPRAVVRRDGLGRDRLLVRRAAHPRRRPGRPAQPRRRRGRARRRRRGPGPRRRDRRPGRVRAVARHPRGAAAPPRPDRGRGGRRRAGRRAARSTTPSGRCSGARRCPAR